MAMLSSASSIFKEIARRAVSLQEPARDLGALIDRICKARIVMLGEASHGTAEFYEWRRLISQILVKDHGFRAIGIEGDWPPCQQVNKFITSCSDENKSIEELLTSSFKRWPTWTWANHEFKAMVEWMKGFNAEQRSKGKKQEQVRVFGLDVYSLFESIGVVLEEVEKIDPQLAEKARHHYACFDPFESNEEEYLQSLVDFPEGCKAEALRVLKELLKRTIDKEQHEQHEEGGDLVFDAQQNARVVRNAESYYRAMIFGNEDSWNVRERHMMETLDLVLNRKLGTKLIVWAHNTHVGDYRATNMRKMGQVRQEYPNGEDSRRTEYSPPHDDEHSNDLLPHVNLGGLAREKYGENEVALVGFGTFQGSVIASHTWGGPIQKLPVPDAKEGSYERIIHEAAISEKIPGDQLYLLLDDPQARKSNSQLVEWRGQRAIGVVYDPKKEMWGNYVPTVLAKRYDAFVFIHNTQALRPLGVNSDPRYLPETYPTGQ